MTHPTSCARRRRCEAILLALLASLVTACAPGESGNGGPDLIPLAVVNGDPPTAWIGAVELKPVFTDWAAAGEAITDEPARAVWTHVPEPPSTLRIATPVLPARVLVLQFDGVDDRETPALPPSREDVCRWAGLAASPGAGRCSFGIADGQVEVMLPAGQDRYVVVQAIWLTAGDGEVSRSWAFTSVG